MYESEAADAVPRYGLQLPSSILLLCCWVTTAHLRTARTLSVISTTCCLQSSRSCLQFLWMISFCKREREGEGGRGREREGGRGREGEEGRGRGREGGRGRGREREGEGGREREGEGGREREGEGEGGRGRGRGREGEGEGERGREREREGEGVIVCKTPRINFPTPFSPSYPF